MTFDELISTVRESKAEQWHKMPLVDDKHDHLAVYKADIDIAFAYGRVVNESFSETWAEKISHGKGRSIQVDLRYRGQLVSQWTFVIVDGGRLMMPMPAPPTDGNFSVKWDDLPIAKLLYDIHATGAHSSLEDMFVHAGIDIV